MPYRKYQLMASKPRRPRTRRVGRKSARAKKLVDGTSVYTKAERMLRAGASTTATVATLARNVGQIMSMINTEVKYIDTAVQTAYLDTLGTNPDAITCVSLIAQGNGDSDRNGNQILLKDLSLRYSFNTNTVTTPNIIRLFVIVDKEFDGLAPTVTQLLEDTNNVHSSINKDYSKRFAILRSAEYDLSPQNPIIHDKMYIKLPFHVFYDSTGAILSAAKENQIFVIAISQTQALPPNLPYMDMYARLNFYDN